ncbi:MAG: hypothetical protein GY739_04040, partial [Mesoflavibacter sp.]|nr:hypothetical protein [Mesoflavibacter sp.]
MAGAPPFFDKVEDLQIKIDEYFNAGVKKRKVIVGRPPNTEIVEIEVPTITGLAYFLGFASRQSFYDYENNKPFSYT